MARSTPSRGGRQPLDQAGGGRRGVRRAPRGDQGPRPAPGAFVTPALSLPPGSALSFTPLLLGSATSAAVACPAASLRAGPGAAEDSPQCVSQWRGADGPSGSRSGRRWSRTCRRSSGSRWSGRPNGSSSRIVTRISRARTPPGVRRSPRPGAPRAACPPGSRCVARVSLTRDTTGRW